MTRQTITVDIAPGKDPVKRLNLTQGDIGRPLGVYIKQNNAVLDCSGYTAELYVLKPDGNYFSSLLTVDETETNLITWNTVQQETPLFGECAAQIRIRQGTINIGTAEFVEYIEKSPNQIGIDSKTDIQTIEQYVALCGEKALEASQSAQSAASSAQSAESSAQDAEEAVENIASAILSNTLVETFDISIGTVAADFKKRRNATKNKSGFRPIGIVGFYISASGQDYLTLLSVRDVYLSVRESGKAIVTYTLINDDGIDYRNVVLHTDLLWIKE